MNFSIRAGKKNCNILIKLPISRSTQWHFGLFFCSLWNALSCFKPKRWMVTDSSVFRLFTTTSEPWIFQAKQKNGIVGNQSNYAEFFKGIKSLSRTYFAAPLFVCHCIRNGLAYIPFHSTLLFLMQGAYSSSKRRVMFFRLWPTSALGKMAWAWGRNSFGLSMAGL